MGVRVIGVAVASALLGCTSAVPARCPWAPEYGAPCATCRTRDDIIAEGDMAPIPSFRRGPNPRDAVPMWVGSDLPEEPPAPSVYMHCRPCDCGRDGRIEPWMEWEEINRAAYARLRTATAPYPVVIVTGYHAGLIVPRYRVGLALKLLERGWVAAIILSGGHRRGGASEARRMLGLVREMALEQNVDVRDRVFIEPCATRTSTNVRNSLRMMAAFGLRRGLLVTESKMTGQATVFASDFDALVARDLRCAVGRVSHLFGMTSLLRMPGSHQGCRALLSFRHNYILFALPRREPVIYWVSPYTRLHGRELSTLECGPGGPLVRRWEPDDQDPWEGECLPPLHPQPRCTR